MTRTARAVFPRAVNKDRSESKTGLDRSIRKGGAGQHNWGSLSDERELEYGDMEDDETPLSENVTSDASSTLSADSDGMSTTIYCSFTTD